MRKNETEEPGYGVRSTRIWTRLLGVDKTMIEEVEVEEAEDGDDGGDPLIVVHARPTRGRRLRCGICERRCGRYDNGEGRRRWRALDLGTIQTVLEADAPRVHCLVHGPTVAAVPWARHAAGHTYAFDEQVAWLATQCSKSAITELMRIAWRTVDAIITRVWADVEAVHDRFADLTQIGRAHV